MSVTRKDVSGINFPKITYHVFAPPSARRRGADFESILAVLDQHAPKTVENEQKRPKIDPGGLRLDGKVTKIMFSELNLQ